MKFLSSIAFLIYCTFLTGCIPHSVKQDSSTRMDKRPYLELKQDNNLASWEYSELLTIGSQIYTNTANTLVTYQSEYLRIQLPYNEQWGTDKFKLHPFYTTQKGITYFGPLAGCEGGGRCLSHWFNEQEAISTENLERDLQQKYSYEGISVEKTKINNKDVLIITRSGLCKSTSYFVPAKNHLFKLQSECDDIFSQENYLDIVKSLQWTDE